MAREIISSKTAVEGVETIEQITLLNELGAKFYQGFYFSKPLTEPNLVKFITSHGKCSV